MIRNYKYEKNQKKYYYIFLIIILLLYSNFNTISLLRYWGFAFHALLLVYYFFPTVLLL